MRSPRVAFIQYTSPAAYPPVVNAATILAERGATVALWGVGAYGAADNLRMELRPGMTQDLMKYAPPGWRQKVHYLCFLLRCVTRTLWWRPRIVYASDLLSYPIAWLISFIPGVSIIAHEHDTPSSGSGKSGGLLQRFRRRLFRRAKMTVIPQFERARLVREELEPARLEVVWNCPRLSEVRPLPEQPSRISRKLWYHGSIVPSQFPAAVIEALALLPEDTVLEFAGYATAGHPEYVHELLELSGRLGLGHRVRYVGTKPTRQELFDAAAKCDVGLALFAREFREPMVGASNKPFDYLACGLAVLTNDSREWLEFFEECPAARGCNPESPQAIAQAVLEWFREPSQLILNRRAGQQMVQSHWNYEKQFEVVCAEILR